MKKTIAIIAILLLMIGVAIAQFPGQYTQQPVGNKGDTHPVYMQAVYSKTDGAYKFATTASAADTSPIYAMPQYSEVWLWAKAYPHTAGTDSVEVAIHVDLRTTDLVNAAKATYSSNWYSSADSHLVVIGDTTSGTWKKLSLPPAKEYRVRAVQPANNNSYESIWLMFKQ